MEKVHGWLSQVEWRDAEDPAERSREIVGESVVKTLLTNRFTNASWLSPHIMHQQKVVLFPLASSFLGDTRQAHISRSTSLSQQELPPELMLAR